MRKAMFLFLFLVPCAVWGQEMREVTGRLADTTGQGVKGAIVVLMEKADSVQVRWDYFAVDTFRLEYEYRKEKALLLYVSAIGYASKYVEVDRERENQGTIVLEPLSISLEEAVVAARQPIGHTYENGKDTYMIPGWIREREYSLNSLLARLPGLMEDGGIKIAGIGIPIYLVNGLMPMGDELSTLTPRDIEQVSISRLPPSKYGTALGVINIVTVKTWRDYLTMRASDNFSYSNVAQDNLSLSVNFRKGKQTHVLNYNYGYSPAKQEMWDTYETIIPEDSIYYLMRSAENLHRTTRKHTLTYTPRYQLTDNSTIDLQYSFNTSNSEENNFTRTVFENGSESESQSRVGINGDSKTHGLWLRYDNRFKGEEKKRLTISANYFNLKDSKDNRVMEHFLQATEQVDTNYTNYRQVYKNQTFNASVDYMFSLGEDWKMEAGVNYGKLWIDNRMCREDNFSNDCSNTENASLYLDMDKSIGRFYCQLGIRGEYGDNRFYFVPSAGMSYRVKDDLNFMLYYRRHVEYPSASDLNANIFYFHKYLYSVGNPDLKPTVVNHLRAHFSFPLNIGLTCEYFYRKDNAVTSTLTDKNNPQMVVITQDNLDKTHDLGLTLSWNRTWGCYNLNMAAGYKQYWGTDPMISSDGKHKPMLYAYARHTFDLGKHISASMYMFYQTAYYYYNVYSRDRYNLSPQVTFLLLKKRLNIRIAGDCLLYEGNYYSRDRYGHTLSISEYDHHPRTLSIGVTYYLNNFINLFKPNETGEEMIKRAY